MPTAGLECPLATGDSPSGTRNPVGMSQHCTADADTGLHSSAYTRGATLGQR